MTRSTKVTLWVLVVLGLLILCGIVTGQPVPEKPQTYYHAEVTQGMGAAALVSKVVPFDKWLLVCWDEHPTNELYLHYWEGTNLMRMTNWTVIETKTADEPWVWRNLVTTNGTSVRVRATLPWQLFRARGEWHW